MLFPRLTTPQRFLQTRYTSPSRLNLEVVIKVHQKLFSLQT